MIRYYRLWDLLTRRGMKKIDLCAVISGPTLTKLIKGESVTMTTIARICEYLDVQPGDILEYEKLPAEESQK